MNPDAPAVTATIAKLESMNIDQLPFFKDLEWVPTESHNGRTSLQLFLGTTINFIEPGIDKDELIHRGSRGESRDGFPIRKSITLQAASINPSPKTRPRNFGRLRQKEFTQKS